MTADIPGSIPDEPAAWLYDATGQTLTGQLENAAGLSTLRRVSQAGSCSLDLPLNDSAVSDAMDDLVVKLSLRGSIRWGCRLAQQKVQHAVAEGLRRVRFETQPDLFETLNEGVVLPEWGLSRATGGSRNFGPMSLVLQPDGSTWDTPTGYLLSDDTTVRAGHPQLLVPSNPYWLSIAGPDVDAAANSVMWVRNISGTLSVSGAAKQAKIVCGGDNFLTVWLNGEQVLSPDYMQPYAWRDGFEVNVTLPPGENVICALVENASRTSGINPLAFACTVMELDDAGEFAGYLLKSNLDDWLVNPGPCGYRRAHVLLKCIEEANTDGAGLILTPTFDYDLDTDGNPWVDTPGTYSRDLHEGLAETATFLGQQDIDIVYDATDMTINAYTRLGTDKRDTVTLSVDPATGTFKDFETTRTRPRFTVVRAQMSNGQWLERTTGEEKRIITTMSLGSVASKEAAYAIMDAYLASFAAATVTVTAETVSVEGPQIGEEYGMGDTVSVTDHLEDGLMPARVMSEAWEQDMPVRMWPADLVYDPTTP